MSEIEELQAELVDKWDELHKKSMVSLLIMLALFESPMWSKELEEWLKNVAGWELNERSLHRTLKRMAALGLISFTEVDAPKTGASRKVFELSDLGVSFLELTKNSSLNYLHNHIFLDKLKAIS